MENENTNASGSENQNSNWLLPASILIAGIIIAVAVIYSTGAKNSLPTDPNQGNPNSNPQVKVPQITANDVVLGNLEAPVTIIEFGDYQCPFCAKFANETENQIIKNYVDTGKVKMVYKDLAFLGPESIAASLAAKCAKDQGKFWEYHDAIFAIEYAELQKVINRQMQTSEGNGNLNRELFRSIASDLKMDVNGFLSCYDSKKYQGEIDENYQEATDALGDSASTPTFFVNGELVQGALPFNSFVAIIEKALNK